jgi:hypothetical protein
MDAGHENQEEFKKCKPVYIIWHVQLIQNAKNAEEPEKSFFLKVIVAILPSAQ